jgi:hypothetical protein
VKGSIRQKAVLKDIKVEAKMILTEILNPKKAQYIAALAGYAEETDIVNVSVSGTLKVRKDTSYPLYSGGVAGYISGAAKVVNSCSRATVTAEAPESKQTLAGGVAGATAKPSPLSMCYAAGDVTARINGAGTADMGGGLVFPLREKTP